MVVGLSELNRSRGRALDGSHGVQSDRGPWHSQAGRISEMGRPHARLCNETKNTRERKNMKLRKTVSHLGIAAAIVCASGLALATNGAGAWQGQTSTDAAHLVNNGIGIFNTDTAASHNIVDVGVLSSYPTTFTIHGYNNNGVLTCNLRIVRISNPSYTYTVNASTGPSSGPFSLPLNYAGDQPSFASPCTLPSCQLDVRNGGRFYGTD